MKISAPLCMTPIMERGMEKADLGENVQTLKEIKQKKTLKKEKIVIRDWICKERVQNKNYVKGKSPNNLEHLCKIFFLDIYEKSRHIIKHVKDTTAF